jgi:hypothetical protein
LRVENGGLMRKDGEKRIEVSGFGIDDQRLRIVEIRVRQLRQLDCPD